MQPTQLIQQRKREWARLENLAQRSEREGVSALSQAELVEFGQLYRRATSDLAIAQRDFPNHDVAVYLNQLVGRAHPVVYRGEPLAWRQLKNFYRRGLPQLYRETLPFMAVAALLLFGPWLISGLAIYFNPSGARYILAPGLIADIESGTRWWQDLNEANQVGAALIMRNNLSVSFLAYAGGILFGLLTVYVLLMNGVTFGAVFGLLHYYKRQAPLYEFVAGHAFLELSVIVMAGGCGLLLGYALLRPGLLTRRDALGNAAQKSIRLLLGVAPLLLVAGAIEGMISPSDAIPASVKLGIGVTSGILLYAYLFLVGRERKTVQETTRRY
ncbi:stage II sporulation protein M [Anaerolineae bacterium CFX7]|nr:stage II sporulation protein M [Anaerolineae bacterium CFX7]